MMIDMQQVREVARPFMGEHMLPVWEEATSVEQPSWMLPELVAQSIGGEVDEEGLVSVTAAIGAMQLSIIVVDDMLDHDERGIYRKVGVGQAANIASGLQAAAFSIAATMYEYEPTVATVLADLARRTSTGQFLDAENVDLTEEVYWRIVENKSCPYYDGCFWLGGLMGGARKAGSLFAVAKIGSILGKMIQVTDDLVDIMASPAARDWWRCSNLAVFYMPQAASQDEWLRFNRLTDEIRRGDAFSTAALREAQTMLIKQGVLAYGLYLLESMREEAFGLLAQTKLRDETQMRELFDRQVAALGQLVS